ncbi:MAG: LptF/LptG family permease [Luteolibacter sp.]|uniref:LptF/LptG family permease n=1 Tax=Luteolibacter sp. TaxID=1962973 RepID=UPI003263D490
MRISDRYIGRQVLIGTLYAVLVLGLVLVLGNLFRQIQPLLVDQGAPPALVLRFVISVLPLSLMYTIPWGFLSAVLLVFRKLSSNQEITSFRVAGLSLVRLSVPVFVIGALLSALSLWLNLKVVPNSKADMFQLVYEQASRDPDSLLKPGVVQGDFGGDDLKKLLIEGKSGNWVEGFNLYLLPSSKDGSGEVTFVHAKRAALSVQQGKSQLRVKLENAYFETTNEKGEVESAFAGYAEPIVIDLKNPGDKKPKANSMSNEEIRHEIATNPTMTASRKVKMQTEITTRYSLSMACLAFAFVAVPLGLQTRRRDTSFGLVISMLIGTAYFVFVMLADNFKTNSAATMVLWAPNVVCVLLGLFLFRKARFK